MNRIKVKLEKNYYWICPDCSLQNDCNTRDKEDKCGRCGMIVEKAIDNL